MLSPTCRLITETIQLSSERALKVADRYDGGVETLLSEAFSRTCTQAVAER